MRRAVVIAGTSKQSPWGQQNPVHGRVSSVVNHFYRVPVQRKKYTHIHKVAKVAMAGKNKLQSSLRTHDCKNLSLQVAIKSAFGVLSQMNSSMYACIGCKKLMLLWSQKGSLHSILLLWKWWQEAESIRSFLLLSSSFSRPLKLWCYITKLMVWHSSFCIPRAQEALHALRQHTLDW